MLNIFPRIVTFEVNLKPTEIMQAIHDNINKETSFLKSFFNSKPLKGSTFGNQFDVTKISMNSRHNIWIHGKLKQTNEQTTKVEVSSNPLGVDGLPLAVLLLFVSIGIVNLLFDNTIPLIDKFNSVMFMLGFSVVCVSIYLGLFFYYFNTTLEILKQILEEAERQKSR